MIKQFNKQAAQGDVMFIKIDKLPNNLKAAKQENGRFIVTHSETGHHHVVDAGAAEMLIDETNDFIAYLKVNKDCAIEHLREHDTHQPIGFSAGDIIQVRRQREYTPQGLRRAQD